MEVKVDNKGRVDLSKRNFVGSGGEGEVYVKKDIAYKVYTKPSRMISEGKIRDLSAIQHSHVIKPVDIIRHKGKPVGYTMKFVENAIPVCQLFTKAYKSRNGIGSKEIMRMVKDMREGLCGIHAANVLVVDLNELNLLVKNTDVYWIDVDSYQTRSYPATAIMDNIRDWHIKNNRWTQGSDWFSWGIITFQLFMGIHPYKGKHSSIKKLSERVKRNVSVFSKEVSVPKMVPSFDTIPQAYRDWYQAIFEDGKRVEPPKDFMAVAVVHAPRVISNTDKINIQEIMQCGGNITGYDYFNGMDLFQLKEGVLCLLGGRGTEVKSKAGGCIGWANNDMPLYAKMKDGKVSLIKMKDGQSVGDSIECSSLMSYGGRFYAQYEDSLMELLITKVGKGWAVSPHLVSNVMPRATQLFDGVVIQNMLGTYYASIFPESKRCYQVVLSDLEGYRVVDAKYDNGVLMVIGSKQGEYDKFVYRFERGYIKAILFWKDIDIDYSGINFVTLDKGVCVHIDENEDMILFGNRPSIDDIRKISDPVIGGDMKLFKKYNDVLFAKGAKLFRISTK